VLKVKTQRLQQMKMLTRSCHRDIEKPALLVDLFGFAACHIRRNTAVDEVENKDASIPAPGGMNGRQDQIVLVELRAAASAPLASAGQCQLGQKTLAGEVAGGDLLSWSRSPRAPRIIA